MKKIENIDQIFKLLRQELTKYQLPRISQEKWKEVNRTPFTTLVSCILSLRTKDDVTDKAAESLLKYHDSPDKILNLSEDEIASLIYPVGFYRTKSKKIKEISKIILDKYDGRVPEDFDELLTLPGVGRKTANIVMVYGHNKEGYLPIDTHCHRIPNRLGWIKTKKPEQTEASLKEILPKDYWNEFNSLFVLFGQKICVPISPLCSKCPIENYCKKIGVKNHR
ncbi:MAG: endonuclease III [Candidatus Thermoplasmatota archaeon]|nr:endonuclease III [Candidatus Thermoplasmatota archaeon]